MDGTFLAWLPVVTTTRTLLLSLAWTSLVAALIAASGRRDGGPGDPGAAPAAWPVDSTLVRAADGPTLVMLAHPRCPCTVASLDELEGVLQRAAVPVRAYVLLVRPVGAPAGFERGAAQERARRLLGAQAVVDVDGREAARFGAKTSGQAVVYDPAGRLCFAGGLTPTRGHRGDGPGRRALLALLSGSPAAARPSAPVFGCPLEEETR